MLLTLLEPELAQIVYESEIRQAGLKEIRANQTVEQQKCALAMIHKQLGPWFWKGTEGSIGKMITDHPSIKNTYSIDT